MQVSIIVPAFNSAPYLAQCVESLLNQDSVEFEVILINDGSTDGTERICSAYAERNSCIKVLNQPNRGLSEARNAGLREAVGEYVLFVDSDDWLTKSTCYLLYQKAKETNADIVLTTMNYWKEDNTSFKVGEKAQLFSWEKAMGGGECLATFLKSGCYTPMVCGNLYRRLFLASFHLSFSGRVHEDERFTPWALYYAARVAYLTGDYYFYRQHETSMMHSYQWKERMEALQDISASLCCFVAARIDKEKSKRSALCSMLWQACALYLRALGLYERLLRRGEEVSLNDFDISLLQQYETTFTEEEREWLDEIELTLLEKTKEIKFLKRCRTDKKQLFVFSRESIGGKYGVGTYIHQLIRCFDREEWSVSVVSLYTNEQENSFEEKEGVSYFSIPYPSSGGVISWSDNAESRYYRSVFYFLASYVCCRQVYCHFNFVHVYELAMLFKEKLNSRNIFTLHYMGWSFDLLGDKKTFEQILHSTKDDKERYLKSEFERERRFMAECCDKVITIAQHSYDTVCELYGIAETKLALIPNALEDGYIERSADEVNQLREKYRFSDKERLLIFAGRLDPVKGISELVEAFRSLQQEIPDVRLIIAGDGSFKHCFDAANPCWSKIIFTGFISKTQLYELYAIADIGITPSLHEEFGYVAVEMMMNKLPVIANSTTGLKEIMGDGAYGVLVDMNGKDKVLRLKEALKVCLGSMESNQKFRHLGRERYIQEYSLEAFQKKIKLLYLTY